MEDINYNEESLSDPGDRSHPKGKARQIQTPSTEIDYGKEALTAPASGGSLLTSGLRDTNDDMSKFPGQMRVGADNALRRAQGQSKGAQAVAAVVGGIGKGVLDIGENMSYMLDQSDTVNKINGLDTLSENWMSNLAEAGKKKIDDVLPIYKQNNDPLSMDSGNAFSLLQGMVDSAVGFMVPGGLIAKGVEEGLVGLRLTNMGMNSMRDLGVAEKLGVKFLQYAADSGKADEALQGMGKVYASVGKSLANGQVGEAAKEIGTGFLSNYMEGKLMGLQSYHSVKEKLQPKIDSGELSEADVEQMAVSAGNKVELYNKGFLLNDMYKLRALFGARRAISDGIMSQFKDGAKLGLRAEAETFAEAKLKERGFKGFMKESFGSSLNEGGEEIGQNVLQSEAERQGLKEKDQDDKSQSQNWMHRWWDMATTSDSLSQGLMGALGGPLQYGLGKAMGAFTGDSKRQKEAEDHQQELLTHNLEAFKNSDHFNELAKAVKAQQDSVLNSDDALNRVASARAFTDIAAENFKNGTVTHLENLLKDIVALNPEDAKEKGYDDAYKQQALDMTTDLGKMEKSYLETSHFANSHELFNMDQQRRLSENFIKELETTHGPRVKEEHDLLYQSYMNDSPEGRDVVERFKKMGVTMPETAAEATSPEFVESLPKEIQSDYSTILLPHLKALGDTEDYNKLVSSMKDEVVRLKAKIINEKTPGYQLQYLAAQKKKEEAFNKVVKENSLKKTDKKAKDAVRNKKDSVDTKDAEVSKPTEEEDNFSEEENEADQEQVLNKPPVSPVPPGSPNAPSTPGKEPDQENKPASSVNTNEIKLQSEKSKAESATTSQSQEFDSLFPVTSSTQDNVPNTPTDPPLNEQDSENPNLEREEPTDSERPEDSLSEYTGVPGEMPPEMFSSSQGSERSTDETAEETHVGEHGFTASINQAVANEGETVSKNMETANKPVPLAEALTKLIQVAYIQRDREKGADGKFLRDQFGNFLDVEQLNGEFSSNGDISLYKPGTEVIAKFTGESYDPANIGTNNADIGLYVDGKMIGKMSLGAHTDIVRAAIKEAEDNGRPYKMQIKTVNQGVLVRSVGGKSGRLTSRMKDKNLKLGVWNGTSMIVDGVAFTDYQGSPSIKGGTYMLLPVGTNSNSTTGGLIYIAAPVFHVTINSNPGIQTSIRMATQIWAKEGKGMTADEASFRSQILKGMRIDIATRKGYLKYIETFVFNKNVGKSAETTGAENKKNKEGNPNPLHAYMDSNHVASGTTMLNISGNSIRFGTAGVHSDSDSNGYRGGVIEISKEQLLNAANDPDNKFADTFDKFIGGMYFHYNNQQGSTGQEDKGQDDFKSFSVIAHDKNGNVVNLNKEGGTYNDFAKTMTFTNLKSYQTNPGAKEGEEKYAYTIHRKITVEAVPEVVEPGRKEYVEARAAADKAAQMLSVAKDAFDKAQAAWNNQFNGTTYTQSRAYNVFYDMAGESPRSPESVTTEDLTRRFGDIGIHASEIAQRAEGLALVKQILTEQAALHYAEANYNIKKEEASRTALIADNLEKTPEQRLEEVEGPAAQIYNASTVTVNSAKKELKVGEPKAQAAIQELVTAKLLVKEEGDTVHSTRYVTLESAAQDAQIEQMLHDQEDMGDAIEDQLDDQGDMSITTPSGLPNDLNVPNAPPKDAELDDIAIAVANLQVPGIPYALHTDTIKMIAADLYEKTLGNKALNIEKEMLAWKEFMQRKADLMEIGATTKVYKNDGERKKADSLRALGYYNAILDNWDAVKHFTLRELSGTAGIELKKEKAERVKPVEGITTVDGQEFQDAVIVPNPTILLLGTEDNPPTDLGWIQEEAKASEAEGSGDLVSDDKDFQGMRESFDDSARLMVDAKLGVSARMRAALGYVPMSIQDKEGNTVYVKNYFGVIKSVGFDQSYNEVVNALSGSRPIFGEQMDILRDYASAKPYFLDLVKKLEGADPKIQREFASAFSKHYLNMMTVVHDTNSVTGETNIRMINASSGSIQQVVLGDWNAGTRTSGLFKTKNNRLLLDQTRKDASLKEFNRIREMQALDENKVKNSDEVVLATQAWLKDIGIDIHKGALKQLFTKGIRLGKGTKSFVLEGDKLFDTSDRTNSPFGEIYKAIESRTAEIKNENPEIASTWTDGADLLELPLIRGYKIKALADLQGKWTPLMMSSSGKSGGKSVYMHHFGRYMTDRVTALKTDVELLTQMALGPYSKHSTWLAKMIVVAKTEERDEKGNLIPDANGNLITVGTPLDKDGNKLLAGSQAVILKDSEFFTKFNYHTGGLQILKAAGIADRDNTSLADLTPLEHEVTKMGMMMSQAEDLGENQKYGTFFYLTMSDKSTNLGVTAPLESFHVDLETKRIDERGLLKLYKALVQPEIDRIVAASGPDNQSNIAGYNKGRRMFLQFPALNDVQMEVTDAEGKKSMESIWLNKADGTLRSGYEEALLSKFGDLIDGIVTDKMQDWRDLGISKDGKLKYIHKDYLEAEAHKSDSLDFESVERHHAADFALNYLIANANYYALFTGDPAQYYKAGKKGKSDFRETFDNMGKRLAADMAQRQQNSFMDRAASKVKYRQVVFKDIEVNSKDLTAIKLLFKDSPEAAKAYEAINVADAAEYTTLREHLYNMVGIGKISQQKADDILARDLKGTGELTPKDIQDIYNIVLQPNKPVYSGNMPDKEGLDRRIYIKSASFPLTRTLTHGLELDNVRRFMQAHNISRAVFQSGWKVGMPAGLSMTVDPETGKRVDKGLLTIHNKDGSLRSFEDISKDYDEEAHSLLLDRKGFGFQQDLPFDAEKEKVNRVTQAAKLLFVNMLKMDGFVFDSQVHTGAALKKIYDDAYGEIFRLSKEKLYSELEVKNGTPSLPKLQEKMMSEATGRGYGYNDKAALALKGDELIQPLWSTPSGAKLEAMLTSLINNNIVATKMPGGSFVLMPEAGFRGDGTNMIKPGSVDDDGVFYVSGYNPKTGLMPQRVENGVVKGAQILLPNRFKALLAGDATSISPDLLRMIGMRIPNQGPNSMAPMEVVGFLPYSAGDVVVAPADFVIQMGSDFDVDKLYAYQYHTSIDENGRLVKYNGDDPIKSLQNKIIDIHHAVLTNEKNMAAIKAPLDGEVLKDLSTKLEGFRQEGTPDTKEFNGMTDTYQRTKFISAATGKLGVGKFSLDATFGAIAQGNNLRFMVQTGDGYSVVHTKFGDILSKGELFNEKVLRQGDNRFVSDIIKAYQTAAVDNEKDPILDKLNINGETMPVVTAMAALGFDERTIGAFMNQPIIREWVVNTIADKSGIGKKFGEVGSLDYLKKYQNEGPTKQGRELLADIGDDEMEEIIRNPTGMLKSVYNDTQLAMLDKFEALLDLGKAIGQAESTVNTDSGGIKPSMQDAAITERKVFNLNSINAGANKLMGAGRVLGHITFEENLRAQSILSEQGYYSYGNMFFLPKTYAGHATAQGLIEGNRLWRNTGLLPYGSPVYDDLITRTVSAIKSKEDLSFGEESKREAKIFSAFKSYLYSRSSNGFGAISSEARRRLFFDSEEYGHTSIARELFNFRKDGAEWFNRNEFLNKLSFDVQAGALPSLIKFMPGSGIGFEDERIYGGFLDLIAKPRIIDPVTGRTTADLAMDLASASYLAGGNQGYTDFIKHVPVALLEKMGFNAAMRGIDWKFPRSISSDYDVLHFISQYLQHNPNDAPKAENIVKGKQGFMYITTGPGSKEMSKSQYSIVGVGTGKETQLYISVDPSKPTHSIYIPLAKLGSTFFQEYDINKKGTDSLINSNNPAVAPPTESIVVPPVAKGEPLTRQPLQIATNELSGPAAISKLSSMLSEIENDTTINGYLRNLARELGKVPPPEGFTIVNDKKNRYSTPLARLTLNLDSHIDPQARAVNLLHEVLHMATVRALIDHHAGKVTPETQAIVDMHAHFQEMVDKMYTAKQKEEFNTALAEYKATPAGQQPVSMEDRLVATGHYTYEEAEKMIHNMYGVINDREFITMAMTDKIFQDTLNNTSWKGGESTLWEKLKSIMSDLFRSLGLDVTKGSALEYALKKSMDIVEKNQVEKIQESAPSEVITKAAPIFFDQGDMDPEFMAGMKFPKATAEANVPNAPAPETSAPAPKWARTAEGGYEVSSKGDNRFSALTAKLRDGRTIEEAYQLDVKGHRVNSNDWREGKGKPPLIAMTHEEGWNAYLGLWQQWAKENPDLIEDLRQKSAGKTLTDGFANTPVSQARALATILATTEVKETSTPENDPAAFDMEQDDFDDHYPMSGKKADPEAMIKWLQDKGYVGKKKFTGELWVRKGFAMGVNIDDKNVQSQNLAALTKINDLYDGNLFTIIQSGSGMIFRLNLDTVKEVNKERGFDEGNKRDLGTTVSSFKLTIPKAQRELFDKLKEDGRLETKCS